MRNKQTFILSLWIEEGETTVLRGLLQSIKSGDKQAFASVEELLALLNAGLQETEETADENKAVAQDGDQLVP